MRGTRKSRIGDVVRAALTLLLASAPAMVSAQELQTDDFSAHRFYIAPGTGNVLMVDGADVTVPMTPQFGVTFGYANQPFVADDSNCFVARESGTASPETIQQCNTPGREVPEVALLESLVTAQLYGAITVGDRVQIGLNVPVFLFYSGQEYLNSEVDPIIQLAGQSGFGIGDPRVHVKVRIVDPPRGSGFSLAAAGWVNISVGHFVQEDVFLGDELPSFGGHLIGTYQIQSFRVSANVGAAFRDSATNLRSSVGPELTWGLGGTYRVNPLIEVLLEATGAVSFEGNFDSEAPTEIRAAVGFHLGDLVLHAGAGAGIAYGVGVPVVRGFLGGSFSPQAQGDSDRDGIADADDGCPTEAEDLDGYADEDGCPDVDNDEDGIPDGQDGCPNDAEDEDIEGADGCPNDDDDGDGIRDGYDSCPNEPEDIDGDRDNDGCPDADRDQDGFDDENDSCPNEAEDFDGLGDEDGCPEEDFDEDGVLDIEDACPEQPEDLDGFQDEDGCAEAGGPRRRRGRRRR